MSEDEEIIEDVKMRRQRCRLVNSSLALRRKLRDLQPQGRKIVQEPRPSQARLRPSQETRNVVVVPVWHLMVVRNRKLYMP